MTCLAIVAGALLAASPAQTATASGTSTLAGRDGVWRVVPAESFVGYRVRERLTFLPAPSDAVGRTSAILGSAAIHDRTITATQVSADARTLKSDESRRDEAVRGLLQHMPIVVFTLARPIRLPNLPVGTVFSRKAPGILRLHGVERNVVFPIRMRWTTDRLEVIGSLQILFSDYRIKRPKFGPVLSVSEHAKIEVKLSFAHT